MEDQSALERNKRINVIERKKKQAEKKKEQYSLKERKSKSRSWRKSKKQLWRNVGNGVIEVNTDEENRMK